MEFGPIDRVISIPGKRLFAAVEGQRRSCCSRWTWPGAGAHGADALAPGQRQGRSHAEFMDPTADASLSADSLPLVR